jgi:hypothetical protein
METLEVTKPRHRYLCQIEDEQIGLFHIAVKADDEDEACEEAAIAAAAGRGCLVRGVKTYTVKPGLGLLAECYGLKKLSLQVLHSAAGFYIGTFDDEGPCTRESVEYYLTHEAAQLALDQDTWTQRSNL